MDEKETIRPQMSIFKPKQWGVIILLILISCVITFLASIKIAGNDAAVLAQMNASLADGVATKCLVLDAGRGKDSALLVAGRNGDIKFVFPKSRSAGNKDRKAVSSVTLSEDGAAPCLVLRDQDGVVRAQIGLNEAGGAELVLKDKDGKTVWSAPEKR